MRERIVPTVEDLVALAQERGVPLAQELASGGPTVPYVIAHRGASGWFPEHTLAAYGIAVLLGADFVEPDLVMTRDGHLVARHDNQLDLTTDVAIRPEFAARRCRRSVDGVVSEGWFSEDFTLAEIKTLRCRERIPHLRPGNARFDKRFAIPTLDEVIELVQAIEETTGRRAGLYPETKHPSHFADLGLPMEQPLVEVLHRYGYRGAEAPIFIQSFETANLERLRTMTDLLLIQLLDEPSAQPFDAIVAGGSLTYGDMVTAAGLRHIASYAAGIGPDKRYLLRGGPEGAAWPAIDDRLVIEAHAVGLQVHPWTFRAENFFLPSALRIGCDDRATGDSAAELRDMLVAGIDGFFTDHTEIGMACKRSRNR